MPEMGGTGTLYNAHKISIVVPSYAGDAELLDFCLRKRQVCAI